MLNPETNERELAYVVKIDNISGMDADRLECAHVRGWNIVVGKKEFDVGDLAVYFEIDSKLPEVAPFTDMEFLKSKHYKIKSQKIRGVVSQGLLMPLSSLKLENEGLAEGDFLTKKLNVTYSVAEDNKRKSSSADKYKAMAQRNSKLAKTSWWRWLYKRTWGKKLLFVFFGRKRDIKKSWPAWVVKTDEERCQNLVWGNYAKTGPWVVTEKIDGTSTTFTCRRIKKLFGDKFEFLVCSRNVVFDKPDKKCFYDINYYTEMAEKHDVETKLVNYLKEHPDLDWVTIQGETFGPGVQKRDYSRTETTFRAFNFIDSETGRWGSEEASFLFKNYFDIPWVPILDKEYYLPETVKEMVEYADGNSFLDGRIREGVVLRTKDGLRSFKAVSNKYLLQRNE